MGNRYDDAFEETKTKLLFDITHYEEAIKAAEKSDYEAAFHSCKAALEPVDAETQYNWGVFYYNGTGVTQDYEKAFKWFKLAADQDYVSALAALGFMYLKGIYVARDVIKAEECMQLAESRGDEQSAYVLGLIYYQGYEAEILPDYEKAWKYLKCFDREPIESDTEQFYTANCIIGIMRLLGQGVSRDYPTALRCLKRAADHNDEEAQYWMGVMYLSGCGIERDEDLGYEWLTKSAENDFEDAKKLLDSKENIDNILSTILENHNQEEIKSTDKKEEHHFYIYETPYFGKPVLTFDLGLKEEEDLPAKNSGWAKQLFYKYFNSAYRTIQMNEDISLNSDVADYILNADSFRIKKDKFLFNMKDYLNDSIESFRKRFDYVTHKYVDIQNNLYNLISENASFFTDKWNVFQFIHQIFDDYIFLIEFSYDIEFLFVNKKYAAIKSCILAQLKELVKVWKASVGDPISNSEIPINPQKSLGVEFSASVSEAVRAFSALKEQFDEVRYTSIVRQVPCYLIENPEYVVLFEEKKEGHYISSYLFEPENVLRHISSVLDVKKTLAIDLNYLETLSDDYLEIYEYVAELCKKSKGIVYVCNCFRPGKVASLLFYPKSRPFGDRKRFSKEDEIVPILTIELNEFNNKQRYLERRPENEVDCLVITESNISYMIPVITEAVKTFVLNAGCYEKGGGLKSRMRSYKEVQYNRADVRISELYEHP